MKPIQMHPKPESEKQAALKEDPMEGANRATGIGASLRDQDSIPDPEVPEKKPRRRFTASYKLRILQEVENCTEPGGVGKILRREGLYSSNLTDWRRARDNGLLDAMSPRKRGRKPKEKNPLAEKVVLLQKNIFGTKRSLMRGIYAAEENRFSTNCFCFKISPFLIFLTCPFLIMFIIS